MKIKHLPAAVRAIAAIVILALIAVGAWRSIPARSNTFDPAQLAANRLFTQKSVDIPIPPKVEKGEVYANGVRLQPGGTMEFDLTRWEGVFWCRFQTTARTAATVEVSATNETRAVLITRRQLQPEVSYADGQPLIMFVDPAALPGMKRLVFTVLASSASSVEWTEIRLAKGKDLTVQRTAPFRVLAYDGLYAPLGEDKAVYIHAPANLSLVVPPGRRQFRAAFGHNPSIMANPDSASDGLGFELMFDSAPAGGISLFRHVTEPSSKPADRELQHATVILENTEPSVLRMVVDAGPRGNTDWDSALWRDFTVEERPAH